jgi:hypothetical protein
VLGAAAKSNSAQSFVAISVSFLHEENKKMAVSAKTLKINLFMLFEFKFLI